MYDDFATIYEKFQDIDYPSFINYYEQIFDKFGVSPKSITDLGCGSGSITIPLAKKGYSVIGADISCEMLSIAAEKATANGFDILFLNQDMTDLELFDPCDVMICALDGVNYLTDDGDLENLFAGVSRHLNPEGLFIFDLNSEYKFENILDENTFIYDEDDAFCAWSNSYDREDRICSFYLDFFLKEENGLYRRGEEYQEERAYSQNEIAEAAASAGLILAGAYDDRSLNPAREDSERIFYVLKKQ